MDGLYQLESSSELKGVLAGLARGETLTLIDERGKPLAVVVSVQLEVQPEQATGDNAVDSERLNQTLVRREEPSAEHAKQASEARQKETDDWLERWDDLAQKIDAAWQGNKSAVETLSEMRR